MPIPGYRRPIPARKKLEMIIQDTLEAIENNFETQKIFPYEVYPGYREINEEAGTGSWKSTGKGMHSFRGQVLADKVSNSRIDFWYDRHLDFVDMGVGKGRPIDKVERRLSADHKIRYMEWNAKEGSTQRPAIAIEFRHQTRRMRNYWANRFRFDAQCILVMGLEGSLDDAGVDLT